MSEATLSTLHRAVVVSGVLGVLLGAMACSDGGSGTSSTDTGPDLLEVGVDAAEGLDTSPEIDTTPVDTGDQDMGGLDTGDQDTEGEDTGGGPDTGEVVYCEPPAPPPEAERITGMNPDGTILTPGGQQLTPAGINTVVTGFLSDVAVDPLGQYAYLSSHGRGGDATQLHVIRLEDGALVQSIPRGGAFYGLEVTPDGRQVWASSGGNGGSVDRFDLDEEGEGPLVLGGSVEVGGFPSGMAMSPEGDRLWVGQFTSGTILEIDTATATETRRFSMGMLSVWDVVYVPGRRELYASDLGGTGIEVVDLDRGEVVAQLEVPTSPAGMAVSPEGDRVWAAVSASDVVVAIDTDTRDVVGRSLVAEDNLVDDEGRPLANSNVNAVWYDAPRGYLYATRGADNAVSVLNADTLEPLGAIPTSWYPTDVMLTPNGQTLVVAEGKGGGAGPDGPSRARIKGSVTLVDIEGLDLEETTAAVERNMTHHRDAFPFVCDDAFPIPTRPDQVSPIEHVVLIVKENKTFDCLFADMDDLDIDIDPSLLRWGQEVTPNQHALARAFNLSDNFYTEARNSDTGHLFLTGTHLTEWVERIWFEKNRAPNGELDLFVIDESAELEKGNFFSHLIDQGISIRVYGEIVGMFVESESGPIPFDFSDQSYPGGPATNYGFRDADKAQYVVDQIAEEGMAQFTFLLLPNDHTVGTEEGRPTPESMVADNDYAVGLFIDALSRSEYWPRTAVFIVQDDPQGCDDHVDSHRSFMMVVSPWARRGYVSHAHNSFLSVFATIERILGVPPIGRPDAAVAPMWDLFMAPPDLTPYDAIERLIPEEVNPPGMPGGKKSAQMDFRSPDRNPELRNVLNAYRLWKMGRLTRAEADRLVAESSYDHEEWDELEEEAEEEIMAFDRDWARYRQWLKDHR
ncbi:MAG: bifunctional YncE family protein/alkaline phosphatase family protein [Myxococcota bacterium]